MHYFLSKTSAHWLKKSKVNLTLGTDLQSSFRYVKRIMCKVKSGIFGQTAEFGQPPCLFHSSVIGVKNKLTKQTVKILMRRLIRSRLIWISIVCKCVSEFT